jgi:ATP-dependent protease ClpP protease subunit/phage major head subunit gpT-like protein
MPIQLSFDGIIGEAPNTAADVRAALRKGGPVAVSINSPGGVATEGLAIFNLLKNHSDRVDVTVDSIALSAGSLIAMAGDSITMREGSLMMIHDPSGVTIGPASAHEKSRDVLDKMGGEFAKIYAQRSGLSEGEARKLMLKETWMDSTEAVDLGFASAASDEGATASAPAFDYRMFKHAPAMLLALTPPKSKRKSPMAKKPTAAAVVDDDEVVVDVTGDILNRCAAANMSATEAAEIVLAAKGSLDSAKDLIIDAVAKKAGDQRVIPGNGDGLGNPDTLATAIGDVLYARMSGKAVANGTPAEDLSGRSLLDLGAMLIQANGGKIKSWHKDRLATQVLMEGGRNSTSDFPFLTQQSGQRILLDAYTAAVSPLKQIARQRSANDFRAIAVGRIGEMPELKEVKEGGEVTYGSRTEASEAFRVRTFARIFSITREAIVNDDLSAFADSARAWGIAAATVEANELYALIAGNGVVMQDGVPLWNAAHGNLAGSATALDLDGLSDGRLAIRNTKGIDGVTPLSITPKFLVTGPANETQAEKVLTAIAAARTEDANVFSGKLTLLVEPRISDFAWYLAADPAQAEAVSYAYLGGRSGPDLQSRDGWTTLGLELRAVHDFGAGATGFRGVYKNAGAEPSEE